MDVEIIGLVTLALGLSTMFVGSRFAIALLAVSAVLGAAAALKMPALGGASVSPAHVLLLFLALACLREGAVRRYLLTTMAFPRAGFWFLLFVSYSILTAFFMPRIFGGSSVVFVLARAPVLAQAESHPLGPLPTNITQSVYMAGELGCFLLVSAMIMAGHTSHVVVAVIVAAFAHLALAFIDLISFHAGMGDVLSFLRNGGYAMLVDNQIKGFKRIVGGFTEAGGYTYVAVGFYAFTLQLWLYNVRRRLNGFLTLAMGLTLILATSTTAYLTIFLYSLIVYAECLSRVRRASRADLVYLSAAPVAIGLFVMGLMLIPSAWNLVTGLFDVTLTNKLNSSSGVERASWNSRAFQNFLDTAGFGGGLGTIRTSSFVVATIANVGAIGAALYGVFLYIVLFRTPGPSVGDRDYPIRRAGRSACIAILISASITLGSLDLGQFFTIFAALATTTPARAPTRRTVDGTALPATQAYAGGASPVPG